jgi:methyltransferase
MVILWLILLISVIVLQRLTELFIAHRNLKWMLQNGAHEYGKQHYPLFFLLHFGWLVGLTIETYLRGAISSHWYLYLGLFIFAQGLRYWSIKSLGRFWNTRILVIPGKDLIQRGPYRYFRHPNYVAVAVELASVPLIFDAWITAMIVSLLNLLLLLCIRIPAEEKALGLAMEIYRGRSE